MRIHLTIGLLFIAAAVSRPAVAGDPPAGDSTPKPASAESIEAKNKVSSFWDVSKILKIATRNIGQRYNLNEEQQVYTDNMMTARVTRFLENHQDEIWPLIRDLAYYQRKGGVPERDEAKRLGPVALKIIREAKEEIYRSNAEWRDILSEQQRQVHDYDLREMDKTFAAMRGNFERWERGRPESARIFPEARPLVNDPPTPKRPGPGLKRALKNNKKTDKEEDAERLDNQFDVYVEKFIKDYELNPTQKEAAYSILREIKARSAAFRSAKKGNIEALQAAMANAADIDARRVTRKQLSELLSPLNSLFVELKTRLETIPDGAQRERFIAKDGNGSGGGAINGSRGKKGAQSEVKREAPEKQQGDDRE